MTQKKDPQELQNVYNDPAYAEVQEMMHEKLSALRDQYQDNDSVTTAMLHADIERAKKQSIYSK